MSWGNQTDPFEVGGIKKCRVGGKTFLSRLVGCVKA